MHDPALTAALVQMRIAYLDLRLQVKWLRMLDAARQIRAVEPKYRPDQPRAPGGTPQGGRWIFAGGSHLTQPSNDAIVAQAMEAITKHAIDQIVNRGVSPSALLDAIQNPLRIRRRPNMTTQYIGKGATVVLNDYGGMVTIWGR